MSSQRMSNADAAWLHMDRPTNLMIVNGLMWLEGTLDVERAKEVIRERLVERFPRYRQRIVEPRFGIGVPSWQDDPGFDLDLHVHRLALPAPGDTAALQELVGDLMTTPLDRTKPLWHMYVIEGYGDGTAILSRMHHCIADGIALTRVLLSLTDDQPDAGVAAAEQTAAGHGRIDALAHVAGAALHEGFAVAAHPRSELPGLLGRAVIDARTLGKLLLTGSDAKTVFKGELGVARKVTWTDRIELDPVKAIGHATGTTVNDVLLAAVSGALHRYMADHGDTATEIRAMVPFNLRPLDQPLPRELGNRFGLVYLTLPVGRAKPAERLADVHRRMDGIKHTPEGMMSYAILGILGTTPVPVERRLIDVFAPKTTAVMTNVPGPRQPIYFAGSKVDGILGWVPASGSIGMGVCIFSYDGGVTIGLQVDPRLVPDPDTIIAAIGEELAALEKAAKPVKRRAPKHDLEHDAGEADGHTRDHDRGVLEEHAKR
jgi:diacylglycerol O-acyltransferase